MLSFKIENDGKQFHAFCPELKGCHTFGSTPEEALKNLKSAITLYLDDEMETQFTIKTFLKEQQQPF